MNGKLPEIWGESLILTLGFRDPISVREKFHCICTPDLLHTFLLPSDLNFSLIGVLSAVITALKLAGASVNAYSPHLRKSGSRTVVGELGESNGEEALPLSLGTNEMKGVTAPLTSTFVMPSPAFLWRFKIGWDSVMKMNADLRDLFLYEAFLYYNPLLLVSNVNYAKIFELDQNHLTHWEIWKMV
ncbi:hypothetical protein Cgig2_029360 [Carnegiea gigantea]|uniref:Uncharacterized protein n=1 Tax=Carnegiea gigantea TaxID=171969 RepID=A0A9Q1QP52_9CARY|nr:hypothetical protein Cgig2_029360 [Carnegiea gigantea]